MLNFWDSFDSGKFSRHEKVRLREAIDNLNTSVNADSDESLSGKCSQQHHSKRLKTTNEQASVSSPTATSASEMPTTTANGGDGIFSCGCSSSGKSFSGFLFVHKIRILFNSVKDSSNLDVKHNLKLFYSYFVDDGSHPCSAESSCDFNGIKRIRLDSSDKVTGITKSSFKRNRPITFSRNLKSLLFTRY